MEVYNSKCDTFSDRDERNKALEKIVQKLLGFGFSATGFQISGKLTSLHSYNSGRRGKARSFKASGSGIIDVFFSLIMYPEKHFLTLG